MNRLKILRVFFVLGLLDIVIFLFYLLRTMSEAKNAVWLGYSWTRLIAAGVIGIALLSYLLLTTLTFQRSSSKKLLLLVKIWVSSPWQIFIFLGAGFIAVVCSVILISIPHLQWGSFQGYIIRLVPIVWWLLIICLLSLVSMFLLRKPAKIFNLTDLRIQLHTIIGIQKKILLRIVSHILNSTSLDIFITSRTATIKMIFYSFVLTSLALGVLLRISSFNWNDRIHGDVNLFALTAREFVLKSRLYYPMKYEYSDNVPYLTLASPASQHPPLWPFAAGLIGKFFHSDDTFTILKIMSEVGGIALILIIAYGGFQNGWLTESLLTVILIAISPMLVDFSANGSSYILSAVFLTTSIILLQSFERQKIQYYIYAGVICGLSLLTHSILFFLVGIFMVFWLWNYKNLNWRGIMAFFISMTLFLLPWMIWNMNHFGKPFYSYSSFFFLRELGLTRTGIFGNVVTTRVVQPINLSIAKKYLPLIKETIEDFPKLFFSEVGPFSLLLFLLGVIALIRRKNRKALTLLLPIISYLIVILLWPAFKFRFLVPLLPLIYIAATFGFTALWKRRFFWKTIAVILFAGTIAWGAPDFFKEEPTLYYDNTARHAEEYLQLKDLAHEFQNFEPGVLLGYSSSLDGGIDTIYYHRYPFVHGREFSSEVLRKLAQDFDVRYIWTDTKRVEQVRTEFPKAVPILQNDLFYVFELGKD